MPYEVNTERTSAENQSNCNTTSGMVLVHVQYVKLFTKACGYVAITTRIPQSHEIKIQNVEG